MDDKLARIFDLQKQLRTTIGKGKDILNLNTLTESDKGTWVRKYLDYMRQEISEAYDCIAFKHWDKQGKDCPNKILKLNNLRIELIDILHFFLDACHLVEMGPEEIALFYEWKQQKNVKRQHDNYDVLTKTEGDNLSLEDRIEQYYNKNKNK